MYRGRHLASDESIYIDLDEIVSSSLTILNTKTGRIRTPTSSGKIPLSGTRRSNFIIVS
jgi:hypothetical protein